MYLEALDLHHQITILDPGHLIIIIRVQDLIRLGTLVLQLDPEAIHHLAEVVDTHLLIHHVAEVLEFPEVVLAEVVEVLGFQEVVLVAEAVDPDLEVDLLQEVVEEDKLQQILMYFI